MVYCTGYAITMTEIPDEITLTLQIADCPYKCEGCHSSYLQKKIGFNLQEHLYEILSEYTDAFTTVCFMGEGRDLPSLAKSMNFFQQRGYKVALYTGCDTWEVARQLESFNLFLDFYKCGHYNKDVGGLENSHTNQRLFARGPDGWKDITDRFAARKHVEIGCDLMKVRK